MNDKKNIFVSGIIIGGVIGASIGIVIAIASGQTFGFGMVGIIIGCTIGGNVTAAVINLRGYNIK